MQSSAMMALRALVLVVCLVAVPLFAIFGKDAPQVVRSLIQNIAGASTRAIERNTANNNDPPVFRPAAFAASGSPNASGASTQSNTVAAGTLVPVADPGAFYTNAPSDPFQRTPNDQLAVRPATRAPESTPATDSSAILARQPSLGAATSQQPAHLHALNSTKFPPDYFRAAEERLRELGATYYLLETLGPTGDYRFYCKVAASDTPQQVFAFFATDHDPLEAINSVVRQVEGWRSHWTQ